MNRIEGSFVYVKFPINFLFQMSLRLMKTKGGYVEAKKMYP
ncbi:hypothetical protein [Emticicia sp. C21]|nr:hypothetical protein [Emticicia sp. C21]